MAVGAMKLIGEQDMGIRRWSDDSGDSNESFDLENISRRRILLLSFFSFDEFIELLALY